MIDKLKKIQSYILPYREKMNVLLSTVYEKLGQKKSVIGIDVGIHSVKVVQMANVNGKMTLVKSALVDIEGIPGNEEEILASLKTALIGVETKGAKIIAIVNCPQTCTRKIVAPYMPRKELVQAVRWEAKNAIPFSIDEALMDFEVLGESVEKGAKKLIVAVAAAPKRTVDGLLSIFDRAGIEISAMIPMSVSLQNLIGLSQERRQATIAVVEMGASVTELNIYRQGRLAFSRRMPIAGRDITTSMTSTLMSSQGKVELSMQEAEEIKKEQGLPSGESMELVDGKILPSQILSLVRPCVEQLAGEIERSFDFFREESHGGRVNKIILFGGGANLKGLAGFLHNEFGMDVEIGNSFEDIKVLSEAVHDKENTEVRFDLAVGAALNKTSKINLLPIELKEKTKRCVENISLKGVIAGIIVSLLLFYIGLHINLAGLNKKMKALKLEKRTLEPQLEELREHIVINDILRDKPYWEDVLKEIGNVIPVKIYLTHLSMDNDIIRLKGDILQGKQDAQEILSHFMLTLEEGIFRDVSLVMARKKEENFNVSEFEITCKVE